MKHPPNEHKIRYQHLVSQPSQTQMPKQQHKNKITARTICIPSHPPTVGPEKNSIAEDKDFKIIFINMLEVLTEEINTFKKSVKTNKQWKEMKKTIQDL